MIQFKDIKIIEVQDLDDLVIKTYGKPYSFQQQSGCKSRGTEDITVPASEPYDFKNDSIPEKINGEEMGVSFKSWLDRDTKEWNGKPEDSNYVDMFWERNFYPDIEMIVNDLHLKGLFPAGEYIINIDW